MQLEIDQGVSRQLQDFEPDLPISFRSAICTRKGDLDEAQSF